MHKLIILCLLVMVCNVGFGNYDDEEVNNLRVSTGAKAEPIVSEEPKFQIGVGYDSVVVGKAINISSQTLTVDATIQFYNGDCLVGKYYPNGVIEGELKGIIDSLIISIMNREDNERHLYRQTDYLLNELQKYKNNKK